MHRDETLPVHMMSINQINEQIALLEQELRRRDRTIAQPAKPCGIADPSTQDCKNMKEVGGGMDGERYRCDVCGKGYFLDYEEMK